MSTSRGNWSDGEVNTTETDPMGTGPMGTGPMGTGPMGTGPMGTGTAGGQAAMPREETRITASAMRRTLARARDGQALGPGEATILLQARGEARDTLAG